MAVFKKNTCLRYLAVFKNAVTVDGTYMAFLVWFRFFQLIYYPFPPPHLPPNCSVRRGLSFSIFRICFQQSTFPYLYKFIVEMDIAFHLFNNTYNYLLLGKGTQQLFFLNLGSSIKLMAFPICRKSLGFLLQKLSLIQFYRRFILASWHKILVNWLRVPLCFQGKSDWTENTRLQIWTPVWYGCFSAF